MKLHRPWLLPVITAFVFLCSAVAPVIGEDAQVLYTSPSGALRIEESGDDMWVISGKGSNQRAKIPPIEAISRFDDEFHASPNDEWIFGLRHGGSGLRDGNLYRRASPAKVSVVELKKSFNESAWQNAAKLHAVAKNFSAAGVYAMTFFKCWSLDSTRLLFELSGGDEKRDMRGGCLYFNTRTKAFEVTDYLRKVNKSHSAALACAEPTTPLPGEQELKARLDQLDGQLNKAYKERVTKTDKDRVANLRDSQRTWITQRDEGLKIYLSLAPAAEKEQRRLQFLGDVTFARLDEYSKPADQDL